MVYVRNNIKIEVVVPCLKLTLIKLLMNFWVTAIMLPCCNSKEQKFYHVLVCYKYNIYLHTFNFCCCLIVRSSRCIKTFETVTIFFPRLNWRKIFLSVSLIQWFYVLSKLFGTSDWMKYLQALWNIVFHENYMPAWLLVCSASTITPVGQCHLVLLAQLPISTYVALKWTISRHSLYGFIKYECTADV